MLFRSVEGEGSGGQDVLIAVRGKEAATVRVVVTVDEVIVAGFGIKLTAQPAFPAFGQKVKW